MIQKILQQSADLHDILVSDSSLQKMIDHIAKTCINALNNDHKIIFCGNGGSFADAQHIAAELVGRFLQDRQSLPAIALGCNGSTLSAVSNDYNFDSVFARELSSMGQKGDVLIGISTSGNSLNIINAIKEAQKKELVTFGFTNNQKGTIVSLCQCIEIPSSSTPRVQECHILIGHILCELIDAALAR